MSDDIKEYSGVANMASRVKGTGQLAMPGHHKDDDKLNAKKKRAKKKKHKKNEMIDFLDCIVNEIVKKKGTSWKLYDDKTKAEIGSYKDRQQAWRAQRIKRMQAKSVKAAERKHKKAAKKQKAYAKQAKRGTLGKPKPKKKTKHEAFEVSIARTLLEVAPYVFEPSPTSQESLGWDNFVARMSHEVMQSDPKLKNLLINLHKTRVKVLGMAHDELVTLLDKTGEFEVGKLKLKTTPESTEPVATFDIQILAAKKKVPLSITIQNNKPLFNIPEQTKALLNGMATKESKLLRAELMHVQETILDHMHDVTVAADKRDKYLQTIEKKLDKTVSSLDPVQIAILRNIMKNKMKGFK